LRISLFGIKKTVRSPTEEQNSVLEKFVNMGVKIMKMFILILYLKDFTFQKSPKSLGKKTVCGV
jgi:hypothetical protein